MSSDRYFSLCRQLEAGRLVCAGVLSGTSADGIDVALCRPGPFVSRPDGRGGLSELRAPELLAFRSVPFDAEAGDSGTDGEGLAGRLRAVLDGRPCSLREQALLSRDLGRQFGRAAAAFARESGYEIGLVGSHGQTVYHHDGLEAWGPATLQLGDGDFVAAAAGAPTVSDFRQADIAAGGEGAPLSALCDDALFHDLTRPAAILNLGGIGNLSLLGERGSTPLAFDTGPAGALLDGLARALLDQPMDEDGRVAALGQADPELVHEFLGHPFLERAPPKSTGRDTFGPSWVARFLERARERIQERSGGHLQPSSPDILASGVELVARCVALGLEKHGHPRLSRLVIAGGGARNPVLVRAVARLTGIETLSSDEFGVPADAREALCFGLLAARFVLDIGSTSERATGAHSGRVLGKFCWQ